MEIWILHLNRDVDDREDRANSESHPDYCAVRKAWIHLHLHIIRWFLAYLKVRCRTSHGVKSQDEESHEDGLGGEQGDCQCEGDPDVVVGYDHRLLIVIMIMIILMIMILSRVIVSVMVTRMM